MKVELKLQYVHGEPLWTVECEDVVLRYKSLEKAESSIKAIKSDKDGWAYVVRHPSAIAAV